MRSIPSLILALALAACLIFSGCASITYQKDPAGNTIVTVKDYTFNVSQPNGLQVTGTPSRLVNNVDIGDILAQVIPLMHAKATAPVSNPIPTPVPTPSPTPMPSTVPTPSVVPPATSAPAPVPITGTITVVDMATLPDEINQKFGVNIASGDIYYATASSYADWPWSPSTYEGSIWLYNNKGKTNAWVDGKVKTAYDALKANPGLQAVAIGNDACDRLGGRLGPPVMAKLAEFGDRVQTGRWITSEDCK